MYADDHQLYETDEDLQVVEEKLAMNAEKASQWYTNNLLKENYDKYKTMTIHKNHTAAVVRERIFVCKFKEIMSNLLKA
jgi:hypothetical protein